MLMHILVQRPAMLTYETCVYICFGFQYVFLSFISLILWYWHLLDVKEKTDLSIAIALKWTEFQLRHPSVYARLF